MKEFKLPFFVQNGGDGSAVVTFTASLGEAIAQDEAQPQGWGECSADTVLLKIEGDKLYFKGFDEKYKSIWIEVEGGT